MSATEADKRLHSWRPLFEEHPTREIGVGYPQHCRAVVLPGEFIWFVREHIGIYWRDLLIRAHERTMMDVDERALTSVNGTEHWRLSDVVRSS